MEYYMDADFFFLTTGRRLGDAMPCQTKYLIINNYHGSVTFKLKIIATNIFPPFGADALSPSPTRFAYAPAKGCVTFEAGADLSDRRVGFE